ncbi:PIN domain-containing protein [Streptomyces longwoodensis]|uniref:PIN domain-containing protein n=1 Tax=Streptomyces longwoodensis TaxID=68231 RepID=UPI0034062700
MFRTDAPIAHYIEQLRHLDTEGSNIIGQMEPVMHYVDWIDKVEGFLRALYISDEPARRLLSRRYWGLAENTAPAYMYKHLTTEIEIQRRYLAHLSEELEELHKIGDRPGQLVVPDTNVLLHFQRIDHIDWQHVTRVRGAIRLVIPVLILDELDEKRYTGSQEVRKRARTALAPINERLADLETQGYAALEAETTLEFLLAGGAKQRGNADSDILDQAEFLKHIAGRDVTVVTGDHGMRARAVARGLTVGTMPQGLARNQDEAKDEVYKS